MPPMFSPGENVQVKMKSVFCPEIHGGRCPPYMLTPLEKWKEFALFIFS
jgi:hypothetical protein